MKVCFITYKTHENKFAFNKISLSYTLFLQYAFLNKLALPNHGNRHNMTQSVKIHSAKVHTVNGVKESTQLQVTIPSGMTGKQLTAWKKRNESSIVSMVESGNFTSLPCDGDDVEGDRLKQW